MSDEKPKTVKVKALQLHTYDGNTYQVGDVYDIDEQYAESVKVQGKAVRVEDAPQAVKPVSKVAEARDLHKPAQKVPEKSTAVEPMTWDPK